jgi:hypothetical protein
MNEMQKEVIPTQTTNNNTTNQINLESSKITNEGQSTKQNTSKPSNPFVDTFREMKDSNSLGGGINDFLKMFEQGGNSDQNLGDIKNLYDILGKLSDNKDIDSTKTSSTNPDDKNKQLESLFGDLLEFLLKSDMLAEPLGQIKISVESYLEKNKDKLKKEEEDKYKSMLEYIDTIMTEIHKKEPNKALVIDTFYKLHELSDIDSDILSQGDSAFKQISELFGGANSFNK